MKARRFASANRSLRLSTIAVASVASLGGTAHAAEGPGDTQSLPCRPTIACTAELVAPGAFELETGALTRRFADHAQQLSDPFLAKLTLTTWVQLQVGSNGYTNEQGKVPARYFDNVYGGPKFHLSDQTAKLPSVSFSFAASLPTVAQEGYVRGDDLFLIGYVTKDIGKLHADLNVGLNRFGIDTVPASQEWVALALSMNLPSPFGVMAESYYFTNAGALASRDGGLLFAINHAPRPWLVFDLGGDIGYFPGTRAFSAFFGATIVPFVLWK